MSQALEMSVRNGPAMMQLTRTLGPYSWAKATVRLLSPPLAAEYAVSRGVGLTAAVEETLMIEPPSAWFMRYPP